MKVFTLLVIGFLGASLSSHAAPSLKLQGRTYSDTGCQYYASSTGQFLFEIDDERITATSEVRVDVRFHDSWTQADGRGGVSINATGNQARFRAVGVGPLTVDSRGSFYFDEIQISYTIRNGDRSYIERGGSGAAFYSADLPARSCQQSEWLDLPLRVRPSK